MPGRRTPLGYQLQYEFLLPDEDRMSGVMAALITRNGVKFLGKQIDDLALAFIAPLRAEHNQITHEFGRMSPRNCSA